MKRTISVLLIIIMILALFSGCKSNMTETELIKITDRYFVLENKKLSVIINRETGYVETVENVVTGMVNKNPESGKWPFYLEYSADGSSIYESSIMKETNNRVSSARTYQRDGRDYLELTYKELLADGSSAMQTGIAATVTFSLAQDDDYFKFNVGLDLTKSSGQVMSLHLLNGGDLRSGDGADEYLIAPAWGRGTKWKNPMYNDYFLVGKTLAYPGNGSESLECGWLDLSGQNQGIGVAYIDAQEMVTEFRIESSGSGMSFDIVLFEPKQIIGGSVPLKAGEKFTTDDVLVSVHQGTWHAVADAYREEFNAAFTKEDGTADYLTAETISKKASNLYFNVGAVGALNHVQHNTVAEMWQKTKDAIAAYGASYEHAFFWQVGINANTYGNDTPLLAPYNEALADPGMTFVETYEKYFGTGKDAFRGLGGQVMQYGHPFAMALNREELTSLFDRINPYQHKEDWDGGEHWSVCMDNDIVPNLWVQTIVPSLKEVQADAVQFDQGSLIQTVCDMEGHNHGLDAVSRLSSGIKSMNAMAKLVRQEIGDEAWILSEASNDLTCRYIDVRQNHWATFAPLWQGENEYGTTMYTHPQYVYLNTDFTKDSQGNLKTFHLQSVVLGGIIPLQNGTVDAISESVRLAEELRSIGDQIGYPHGYRDTLGMKSSAYSLFARVYVQGDNVTVVYCANNTVEDATITVDLDALGFEGKGTYTFNIDSLETSKGGYQTYTVK